MTDAVVQSAMDYLKKKEGFDCKELLGQGTYGSVFKISSEECGSLAAKIVANNNVNGLELRKWEDLKHTNILRLEKIILKAEGVVIFITELMDTNLFHRLQNKDFKVDPQAPYKCRMYAEQVLCGLSYLHRQELCHLDLRAENIFIGWKDRAVVADFSGLSKTTDMKYFCPLPTSLRPPEMLENRRRRVHPLPIDLWAYGLLLANMFLGKGFYACTVKHEKSGHLANVLLYTVAFRSHVTVETYFSETYPNSKISKIRVRELITFMSVFLQMDPSLRMGADEALKSNFFTGRSFLDVSSRTPGAASAPSVSGLQGRQEQLLLPSEEGAMRTKSEVALKALNETNEANNLQKKRPRYEFKFGNIKIKVPRFKSKTSKAKVKKAAKKESSSSILL